MSAPAAEWDLRIERDEEPEEGLRFTLVRAGDMPAEVPPWLVQDVLYGGTLVMLYAPPESFKSFVAIALACSVASGRPFGGQAVRQGAAVYVSAEGGFLIRRRVEAWCEAHGARLEQLPLWFLPQPLPLTSDRAVDDLLHSMRQQLGGLSAELVAIDTLAECAAGANENSVEEMQPVLNRARRITTETGAAVILLHHTNASAERERGSTALRGSCDTIWKAERDGMRVTVRCDKQRDAPRHLPVLLSAVECGGSLALADSDSAAGVLGSDRMPESRWSLLRSAAHSDGAGPFSSTTLRAIVHMAGSTFFDALSDLVARGYMDRTGTDHRPLYRVSHLGFRVLTPETPN